MTKIHAKPEPQKSKSELPAPTEVSNSPDSTPAPTSCDASPFAYSDIVKEHFLNPKNFLTDTEEKTYKADTIGLVGNPICGDQMKMFLKIDKKTNTITDIRWKTYGCASAIASTSALSELAKGRTLDDALEITPEEISTYLGGLPERKIHCSVLGHDALKSAIENYKKSP